MDTPSKRNFGDHAVDHDDRAGEVRNGRFEIHRRRTGRRQDDALHPMRRQEAKRRQLFCWVVIGFAEQNVVAERIGNRADASHQFREEGVGDVGDDHSYQSRRLHPQPLSDSRRREAQLRHSFLDARLERRADETRPVDDVRDRRRRHPGETRNVLDCRVRQGAPRCSEPGESP